LRVASLDLTGEWLQIFRAFGRPVAAHLVFRRVSFSRVRSRAEGGPAGFRAISIAGSRPADLRETGLAIAETTPWRRRVAADSECASLAPSGKLTSRRGGASISGARGALSAVQACWNSTGRPGVGIQSAAGARARRKNSSVYPAPLDPARAQFAERVDAVARRTRRAHCAGKFGAGGSVPISALALASAATSFP
jgi:hypothetical protein